MRQSLINVLEFDHQPQHLFSHRVLPEPHALSLLHCQTAELRLNQCHARSKPLEEVNRLSNMNKRLDMVKNKYAKSTILTPHSDTIHKAKVCTKRGYKC